MSAKSNDDKFKVGPSTPITPPSYPLDDNRKARYPSDVIKDAKNWCALRAINTKRPATPLDSQRSLFGSDIQRTSRPPSAYSLGAHHFDASDVNSRPGSGAILPIKSKLEPLKIKPIVPRIDKLNSQRKSLSAAPSAAIDGSPSDYHRSPTSPVKAYTDYKNSDVSTEELASVRYHPTPAKQVHQKPTSSRNNLESASSSHQHITKEESATVETKDQALYWNTTVLPLLEQLEEYNTKEPLQLCKTCSLLHEALHKNGVVKTMLPRRRTSLLSSLFRLLNVPSDDLHLKCARIVLQVRVNNKNLTSICKLLFRVSRNRNHDQLFVENQLIEPMLNLIEETDNVANKYEALVYLCGSLKFLSENKTVASVMYENSCIKIFTGFIATLLEAVQSTDVPKRLLKQTLDILVQVTEAFRNMLDADKKVKQSAPSVPTMLRILHLFGAATAADQKLAWILSRIFSKLTVYDSSIPYFVETPGWSGVMLTTLRNHMNNDHIVVRLCFALGNILSYDDQSRDELFFGHCDVTNQAENTFLDLMLEILGKQIEAHAGRGEAPESKQSTTCYDVIIKSIRVIANMTISERVGETISRDQKLISILMDIIGAEQYLTNEEIITNSLVALNNLAYFDRNGNHQHTAVYLHRIQLTSILIKLMMNEEMMKYVAEIARVLGNLTKYRDVRNLVHQHKVDLMMTALIDSGDAQVVYNACGMLINISGDHQKRAPLLQEQIICKLSDVMRDFAPVDWTIAGISCQLSWNLLAGDFDQSEASILPHEVQMLKETLSTLLDENEVKEKIIQVAEKDEDKISYLLSSWKDNFLTFAEPLYTRLQNLPNPSQGSMMIPLESCDV